MTTDILRVLLLFMMALGVVLAGSCAVVYSKSSRRLHVTLLALAYTGFLVVSTLRIVVLREESEWVLCGKLGAAILGNIGMIVILFQRNEP